MRYLNLALIVLIFIGLFAAPSPKPSTLLATTHELPLTSAPPACARLATPEATAAATMQAPITPTPIVTVVASSPLQFTEFLAADIKFNPNTEKPAAVVMVFTLVFKNLEKATLEIEKPQFELSIEGVPWGKLASTDFYTGRLQAGASLGIVLQSLTVVSRTTPAQKAVLECLKEDRPVDLGLTGTLDVYPGGAKQTLNISLLVKQVVIRSRHP